MQATMRLTSFQLQTLREARSEKRHFGARAKRAEEKAAKAAMDAAGVRPPIILKMVSLSFLSTALVLFSLAVVSCTPEPPPSVPTISVAASLF